MMSDPLQDHTGTNQGHAASWQTVPSIVTNAGEKAIAAYLEFLGQAKWSPATRRLYSQHSGRFFRWAAERGLVLDAIGAREVDAYASELAVSVSSQVVRVYLTPIYGLLRHMVGAGVYFTDGFAENPYPRRVISAAREWPLPKIPLEELVSRPD